MPTDAEILQRVFPEAKSPADLPAPVRSYCESYYHLAEIAGVEGGIPASLLLHVILEYLSTASPVAAPDQEEDATERSDWFAPHVGEQVSTVDPTTIPQLKPTEPTFLAAKRANPAAGVWIGSDGVPTHRRYPKGGEIEGIDPAARIPQGAAQPAPLSPEVAASGQSVSFVHPRDNVLATGILRGIEGDMATVRTRNVAAGQDEEILVPVASCNI